MINDQWLMKYLLLLFFPFLMKGQVTGVRTAYTFTNGVYHYGFVGASQNSEPFYAGFSYYGGTHIGSHKGTVQFVPEIGIDFYALLFGMGLSVNTHAITPHAGVSLVNKYQIQAGYSLPLRNEATFHGFTLSIVINAFEHFPW